MTDNEIIKALECCTTDNCRECPLTNVVRSRGCDKLWVNALALIKQQKAELEYERAKAIADFARKAKKELSAFVANVPEICCVIDNLVKEMTEGGVNNEGSENDG
jgi:hypothetical protein